MLVSVDKIPQILVQYVDQVLKPKVQGQGSMLSFGVGAARYLLPTVVQAKVTELLPMLKAMGLVTEAGMLDVEKAESAAKSGLDVSGKLNILSYRFDADDVAALVAIAKEYANG